MTVGFDRAREPLRSGIIVRTGVNLYAWTAALLRAQRRSIRADTRARELRRLAIGAVLVVVWVLASVVLVDAWAIGQQRTFPRWLVLAFETITDLGRAGYLLVPLAVLLVVLAATMTPALDRSTRLVATAIVVRLGFLFTAVALPGLVVTVVKRLIGRARPMHLDGVGPLGFEPFAWKADFASLPSGHGTTAFATAVAISVLFPRARLVIWPLAALVALSRVVVAAHYPSDVIAGAACGIFGAMVVTHWFAARRLGFAVRADGSVTAFPGPSLSRLRGVAGKLIRQ